MKKKTKTAILILLTVYTSSAVWAQLEMSSHEVLFLGAAAGIFFLLNAALFTEKRLSISQAVLGAVFALCMVLGKLDAMNEAKNYMLWTAVRLSGLWVLFALALKLLFERLCMLELADVNAARDAKKCRRVFFGVFAALVIWYGIWWLYEYPGNTSPDSNNQMMQALGLIPLTNHHPALNTLFIRLVFTAGLKVFDGNQNLALGLYTFVQLVFMALCFAYTVAALYGARLRKGAVISVALIYLLVPYHASYSVTVWKDVPFGAMMLVMCTVLWQMTQDIDGGRKIGTVRLLLFSFSALGVCLLRSNGLYAFILSIPFIVLTFGKKYLNVSTVCVAVAAAAIAITGPLYSYFNIKPADFVESLSLPAQQIARVFAEDGNVDAQEAELLSRIVPPEGIKETYNEHISDPIKALIRSYGDTEYLSAHKSDYFRLWLKIGIENPGAYLRAFIDQTMGYWYPDVQYWSMSTYCEDCDELEIYKDRLLPDSIGSIFADTGFYLPKLPFGGLLFSIGLSSWILLTMLALCIEKKVFSAKVIFVPVLAMMATLLIATPVYAEFRYAYGMFTTLPLLCVIPFGRETTLEVGEI